MFGIKNGNKELKQVKNSYQINEPEPEPSTILGKALNPNISAGAVLWTGTGSLKKEE